MTALSIFGYYVTVCNEQRVGGDAKTLITAETQNVCSPRREAPRVLLCQCETRRRGYCITRFGVRSTKKTPQCFSAPSAMAGLPFHGSSKASKKNTVVLAAVAQSRISL